MTDLDELRQRIAILRQQYRHQETPYEKEQTMPWGKYKGTALRKMPRYYMKFLDERGFRQRWPHLFWFYDNE